jgi:hypothetical protein
MGRADERRGVVLCDDSACADPLLELRSQLGSGDWVEREVAGVGEHHVEPVVGGAMESFDELSRFHGNPYSLIIAINSSL